MNDCLQVLFAHPPLPKLFGHEYIQIHFTMQAALGLFGEDKFNLLGISFSPDTKVPSSHRLAQDAAGADPFIKWDIRSFAYPRLHTSEPDGFLIYKSDGIYFREKKMNCRNRIQFMKSYNSESHLPSLHHLRFYTGGHRIDSGGIHFQSDLVPHRESIISSDWILAKLNHQRIIPDGLGVY